MHVRIFTQDLHSRAIEELGNVNVAQEAISCHRVLSTILSALSYLVTYTHCMIGKAAHCTQ
jgi:hypothetical protein